MGRGEMACSERLAPPPWIPCMIVMLIVRLVIPGGWPPAGDRMDGTV